MKKILEGVLFLCRSKTTILDPNHTILLAMKLVIFLSLAGCLQVTAKGYTQTVTFSGTNVTLKTVFAAIQQQTGLGVFIDEDILKETRNVSVNLQSASIEETLKTCFKMQPISLDFYLAGRTIIVKRKVFANPTVTSEGEAPSIKVWGIVLNEEGQPLAGASVMVKGSSKSTITNAKGEFFFSTEVPVNSVLIISYVGYTSEKITLTKAEAIHVSLAHASNALDATVIKGYYNTTQRLNTGNVTTVKGDDIQKQPVTDPILALEGRVAGLYIQQSSGVPGALNKVQIRGQNSIFNGNDPLFIVDGVPFSATTLTSPFIYGGVLGVPGQGGGMSPFNALNPSDIESIEVLKDADATAIYGSRGANGVILINTKKGKAGKTTLNINAYAGVSKVTRTMDLLNTEQYLSIRKEFISNAGFSPDPDYDYDLTFWDTTRYTNWQKVLIDNPAPFTNLQASLSGGTTNTQFVISAGYSKQKTVFPGDYSDQKGTALVSLTHYSTDQHFQVQFSASYSRDNSNLNTLDLTSFAFSLAPDAPPLYDAKGNLNWAVKNGSATWNNPLAVTLNPSQGIGENLVSNLVLDYKLLPGLHIKTSAGYNSGQMDQTILTKSTTFAPPDNLNPYLRNSAFASTKARSWIIEPQLNYSLAVGKGTISLIVGSTFQENTSRAIAQTASGFTSDALLANPQAATTVSLAGFSNSLYHYDAIFGRIGFNWDEKYLLNLTGRRDGSSRFGPGKQFGNFGAIGLGWIFTKEKFIERSLSFLNFGKLRGSYGITGNDQIGDYGYLSTYSSSPSAYLGYNGLYPTALTNPYFAWEQVKKLEGAVELGFLKDRILLSTSYFRNRCGNQLTGYVLPAITGFGSVQANLPATVQNTGWEFTLNTINIRSKNFSWSTSTNLSIPRNKLLSFPNIENSPYVYIYFIGRPLSSQFLLHSTGVDPQTGLYSFQTKNSNGRITLDDYHITKPITQSFYGGVGNSWSYKKISLDVFLQFSKQLGTNYLLSFPQPGQEGVNQPRAVLSRWRNQGDVTAIQKISGDISTFLSTNNLKRSDARISDASFIRVKNIYFSYGLPPQWTKKVKMEQARFFLQCQNLLTITGYKGLDPETGSTNLPPLRTVTAGINLTF